MAVSTQQQQPDQSSNNDEAQAYTTQGNRATVLYETRNNAALLDEDDELTTSAIDEVDPLALDGDELPDISADLPDDPESTEDDEFVEGSPRFEQFKSDFNKAFGLPMEEARDLVQSLRDDSIKRQVNEQKYELSAAWQISVTEVEERLAVVHQLWSKLPADKQQAYDNPKGAQVLYARYEQSRMNRKGTQGKTKTASQVSTPANKWMYTQRQIDQMDAATYSKEADRIMLAYAQGRVRR
jgi:hypothetical protein